MQRIQRGSWRLPMTLALLGALAWACQDGSGLGGTGDGTEGSADGGDGDGDGDGDGGGPTRPPDPDDPVDRNAVLWSVAYNVIVPATAEFAAQAQALDTAVDEYAAAMAADPTTADPTAARQAWAAAMAQWQVIEVMQVGPTAPSLIAVAGEDIRDSIYSWPTADACSVDRALADELYATDDFFATQLVWSYGLDALEYLVFNESDAHRCPAQVQLDPAWDGLGADTIALRRAQYAAVVSEHLVAQANLLSTRWSPDADNFAGSLATAGMGDSPYETDGQGLDEVFRGMFYVDKQTKDGKLGAPIGLVDGCPEVPCLNLLEAPLAGTSTEALRHNLEGLRQLVLGGADAETGIGFDDLLAEIGEPQIGQDLLAAIDNAIGVIDAFEPTLQDAIATDPDTVVPVHAAIKSVTDILKGPFVMALLLTVPAEGAGDND